MRAAVPFLLLSLLLTGCDPFTFKNVSLNLQPQTARNVVLTTNDLPVHEAMNLIDTTIVSNGFARDPSPIAPEDQARGVVAFYGICTVTLSSNRLDVAFLQRYSRHFSAPARKAIEQLKDKLSSRYGKENITVQN